MESLGLCVSDVSVQSGTRRDSVRVRKAEGAAQQPAKRRRQVRKTAAQKEAQRREEEEVNPYQPGDGGF